MDLIPQLKQEHVEIMRAFELIKEGVSNGDPGDKDLINDLRELKTVLVAHLDLEDKMIYPALQKCENENAKELGEKFSEEMLGISKIAMAFFGKYMSETIDDLIKSSEFRRELNEIMVAVTKRVELEESQLYPAYELCKE